MPDGKVDFEQTAGIIGDDGKGRGLSVTVNGDRVRSETVMRQVYGLDIREITGYDSFGTLFNISTDGCTILCQPGYRSAAISAYIPVPFEEAAREVNLLCESTVFPAPGSVMSRLPSVTVSFACRAKKQGEMMPYLADRTGNRYEALSVTPSPDNCSFSIDFPDIPLLPGEVYDLVLPEGIFITSDGRHLSPIARIQYKGRPDTPLAPLRCQPAEGSAIPEVSVYSMVVMEFDTHPVLLQEAEAFIYEGDTGTPLAPMVMVAEGNRIGLYTSAGHRLSKGKDYRIVISAGSFTDPVGNCPNNEITLRYRGSYVLTPPEISGNRLFYDDFSDPGTSLGRYLFYEGDHLTPVDEMVSWGFDNDNTPWNFSVRDDGGADFCAAATSRYIEEGAADDWMLLPPLRIDSDEVFLSFKAQSYISGCDDRLTVLGWESDETFGRLDDITMNSIKKEARILFDGRLSPGMKDDRLEGDWREYEIPLGEYKGKNLYIAFANINDGGSAVFVDDILVESRGNFSLSASLPEVVVGPDPLEVRCHLNVDNDVVYTHIAAEYIVETTGSRDYIELDGLNLGKGDSFEIVFPRRAILEAGEENYLRITVSPGEDTGSLSLTILNPVFEVERSVLIEEGTGEWCGFCPGGFVALDYLQEKYPGRIAEVSIHNNDSFAFESYVQFLGFSSFPSGRVDRLPGVLVPLVSDPQSGLLSLTSRSGKETFADAVERRINIPSAAALRFISCSIDTVARSLEAEVEVTPAINLKECGWNLFSVLTEYDVVARQQNYYSGSEDPLMQEWSRLPGRAEYPVPAVARSLGSMSFHGEPGLLPENIEAGENYRIPLRFILPDVIERPSRCRLVVALVSGSDGTVINSASAGYGIDISDSDLIPAEESTREFTCSDGWIFFHGMASGVRVYDLSGGMLENGSLMPGVVIAVHPDASLPAKFIIYR